MAGRRIWCEVSRGVSGASAKPLASTRLRRCRAQHWGRCQAEQEVNEVLRPRGEPCRVRTLASKASKRAKGCVRRKPLRANEQRVASQARQGPASKRAKRTKGGRGTLHALLAHCHAPANGGFARLLALLATGLAKGRASTITSLTCSAQPKPRPASPPRCPCGRMAASGR